jgi:CRISPR/Cas system-associated exonuclease Cas4 (RecB family)
VVGGGEVLQPVLYSLAAEVALGVAARKGRLFYCTARGGFAEHEVVLNKAAREQGKKTLQIIDTAVEKGFLPAAPREGACQWCDFRTVCGPYEELRIQRKEDSALRSLSYLRDMP